MSFFCHLLFAVNTLLSIGPSPCVVEKGIFDLSINRGVNGEFKNVRLAFLDQSGTFSALQRKS